MVTRLRKPTAERRTEIVRAALGIIGRQGLTSLTTQALADAVGVTSGALFRHFASFEAIFEEAVRWAETRLEATFPAPDLPALARLRGLAEARVRLFACEPGLAWLLRSEQAFLTLPEVAVKRLRRVVRRSRTFMRAALAEAIAAGDVRADVAPGVLLVVFTATVHALIAQPGLQGRTAQPARSDPVLAGLFHLLAPPAGRPPRR